MISIEPARRLGNITEYYFSQKLKEIERRKKEGQHIINLGIGKPDLPPSEKTIDKLSSEVVMPDNHGYQPQSGLSELREAYAHFYSKNYQVILDPQTEIQPLMGSKQGIFYLSMALLNPGDKVLIPNPGYPAYSSISNLLGVDIEYFDLKEENDWLPDFREIESLDLSKVKLMWLNYPNMPTGAKGSLELFEKAVSFARKHHIVIAHDNPYSLILNDTPISIMQVDGARDVCVELNSMSKSHNISGWRMAMLTSNERVVRWVLKVISNIESGIFKPLQIAAAEALNYNSADWHQKNNNHIYAGRRQYAQQIFQYLGCTFNPDQVGMFLWGKIPPKYVSSTKFVDEILDKASVFLAPGSIFGSNGEGYVRLSLCSDENVLSEALSRIKQAF